MSRAYLQRDEFDRQARAGAAPTGLLRKQFLADDITQVDGMGDRVRRFCLSTGAVDRDNDTIVASGWRLDNYRKNPVVLWAHDYSALPIARARAVGVEGDRLVASAEFASHPMADTVLQLIDGGFLRAASVGFLPAKYVTNVERGGYDFLEQDLLEFSIVPVPANPEALIEARAAGVDVSLVKAWADGVVAALKDEEVPLKAGLQAIARKETWGIPHAHLELGQSLEAAVAKLTDDERDVLASQLGDSVSEAETVKVAKRWAERANKTTAQIAAAELIEAVKAGLQTSDAAVAAAVAAGLVDVKQGRVLSRAHESQLRQAKDAIEQVLQQLEAAVEDEDTDVIEFTEPPVPALVREVDDEDPVFDVDANEVRQLIGELIAGTLTDTVGNVVRETTMTTMNRMRGRVD